MPILCKYRHSHTCVSNQHRTNTPIHNRIIQKKLKLSDGVAVQSRTVHSSRRERAPEIHTTAVYERGTRCVEEFAAFVFDCGYCCCIFLFFLLVLLCWWRVLYGHDLVARFSQTDRNCATLFVDCVWEFRVCLWFVEDRNGWADLKIVVMVKTTTQNCNMDGTVTTLLVYDRHISI